MLNFLLLTVYVLYTCFAFKMSSSVNEIKIVPLNKIELKKALDTKYLTHIITDIDGTLINDANELSIANRRYYSKLVELELHVIVATGRSILGVEKVKEANSWSELNLYPGVYLNGATIYGYNKEILMERFVKPDVARKLLAFVQYANYIEMGKPGWDQHPDILNPPTEFSTLPVIDKSLPNSFMEIGFYSRHLLIFPNKTQLTDGFSLYQDGLIIYDKDVTLALDSLGINKIVIITHAGSFAERYYQTVKNIVKKPSMITSGLKRIIEINPEDTNKGEAMLKLLIYMKQQNDKSLVIGDGLNDVELFEKFPLSIAMGNAVPQLKRKAMFLTDTVENDGWAKAMNVVVDYYKLLDEIYDVIPAENNNGF